MNNILMGGVISPHFLPVTGQKTDLLTWCIKTDIDHAHFIEKKKSTKPISARIIPISIVYFAF